MSKVRKINNILVLVIIIMFCLTTNIQAAIPTQSTIESDGGGTGAPTGEVIDPNDFKPGEMDESFATSVTDKGALIVEVIQAIGIIVIVVWLMLIGIKYMTGSIEEKAEYKKTIIYYLIGVAIFVGLIQLLKIVIKFAESFNA